MHGLKNKRVRSKMIPRKVDVRVETEAEEEELGLEVSLVGIY